MAWMVFVVIVVTAPAGVSMPTLQAWMSKMTPADAQGRLQGMVGGAEGLSSIIGPIVMSQTFGAFEHTIKGAPLPRPERFRALTSFEPSSRTVSIPGRVVGRPDRRRYRP
jgi:MFS family permease